MHKIRLTDIRETQQIMNYRADKVKIELLKRFLNDIEIERVLTLLKDFPFNDYELSDVEKAFELIKDKNLKVKLYNPEVIEFVLNDIRNGRYKF